MSAFDLDGYLQERRALVDAALERFLPGEDTPPPTVHRAMRYSVMAGGKRLRPILVIAGAEAVGAAPAAVMPTACASGCSRARAPPAARASRAARPPSADGRPRGHSDG